MFSKAFYNPPPWLVFPSPAQIPAPKGPATWTFLYGTEGNDGEAYNPETRVHGTPGNDHVYLLGGDDFYSNDFDSRYLGGYDTIYGGYGNDTIYIDYSGGGTAYGGVGEDKLFGGNLADYLYGEDNNDIIVGSSGDDFIYGGYGDDILTGDRPLNVAVFNPGNDTIDGGPGKDWIWGGGGVDRLTGGTEDDIFYFKLYLDNIVPTQSGAGDVDTITDLSDTDIIRIELAQFELVVGTYSTAVQNVSSLNLADNFEGFVYDTKQHDLWYDTGSAGFLIVHIEGHAPAELHQMITNTGTLLDLWGYSVTEAHLGLLG
jgi:Ca2+-binding RTX toxin-like protein